MGLSITGSPLMGSFLIGNTPDPSDLKFVKTETINQEVSIYIGTEILDQSKSSELGLVNEVSFVDFAEKSSLNSSLSKKILKISLAVFIVVGCALQRHNLTVLIGRVFMVFLWG